jgi:hypothetical protein
MLLSEPSKRPTSRVLGGSSNKMFHHKHVRAGRHTIKIDDILQAAVECTLTTLLHGSSVP